MISHFLNKIFNENTQLKINILFFLYIFCYLIGPAVINIYVTLLALSSLFYLVKNLKLFNKLVKDRTSLILIILCGYIITKDFFLGSLNIDFLSFLRFVIIFLSISIFLIKKDRFFSLKYYPLIFLNLILFFDTFFQYIFGFNLVGFDKYQSDRLTSFFNDEPIIGSFLMKISLPIIFYLIHNKFKNSYTFSFILISIFCVMISGERMPFLQLCFGILLIFLIKFGLNFKKITSFIAIFLLGSFVLLNLPNVKERYISTFQGFLSLYQDIKSENQIVHQISKNGVYDYYLNFQSGIQLWKKNYFFGNGYRYYNSNCNTALSDEFNVGCSTHPHNIYIEILSDHGVLGLALFLLFIIFCSYDYFKNLRDSSSVGFYITLLVISVPFVTSQSIFSSFYGSIYFLSFFIIRFMTNLKIN